MDQLSENNQCSNKTTVLDFREHFRKLDSLDVPLPRCRTESRGAANIGLTHDFTKTKTVFYFQNGPYLPVNEPRETE